MTATFAAALMGLGRFGGLGRRVAVLALATAVLALAGACRSADKPAAEAEKAPRVDEGAALTDEGCREKPKPASACCEALTPACNDCREKADKALTDYQARCLSATPALPADCAAAPVISCCGEDSEECRKCREDGLAALVAFRERCAVEPEIRCDHKPPVTLCCDALIPSCEACRERNRRVEGDWLRRCR